MTLPALDVIPLWRYHRGMAMDDAGCVTAAIAAGVSPAVALFRSLGDETRLRIVARLAAGEARVVDLTGELGLAQSTVSKHLACLRGCGLVDYRAEGRQSFYALTCPELMDLLQAAEGVLAATGATTGALPGSPGPHHRRPWREQPRARSSGHGHGPPGAGHRRALAVVLGISGTILAVEVIGAFVSGSLALLADAGHMLTDVAGLSLALVAAVLAGRPATQARTWGYRRAEVLAAAAQAAVLLAVGGFVLAEAIRRLVEPSPVASGVMVIFGVVGLAGNAVSIVLLSPDFGRQPEHPGRAAGSHQRRPRFGRRAGRRRTSSR